ncbi:uncharacterized protein [Clytia hemisphaerica]|eukprot:TCONS_00051231-protein
MNNNNIIPLTTHHDLELRIKCLLLNCQSTLADLLRYFVSQPWEDIQRRPGDEDFKLQEILKVSKKINDGILTITVIPGKKTFAFDPLAEKIEIDKLESVEICALLLSKNPRFMRSIRCCYRSEHQCLTCIGSSLEHHIDCVSCYKKRCTFCGQDSKEEIFIKYLVLIRRLAELVSDIQDPEVYECFRRGEAILDKDQLTDFKSWEQLWQGVQKGFATFNDFLVSTNQIRTCDWKDRDMYVRIVLKERMEVLQLMFGSKWRQLMLKEPINNRIHPGGAISRSTTVSNSDVALDISSHQEWQTPARQGNVDISEECKAERNRRENNRLLNIQSMPAVLDERVLSDVYVQNDPRIVNQTVETTPESTKTEDELSDQYSSAISEFNNSNSNLDYSSSFMETSSANSSIANQSTPRTDFHGAFRIQQNLATSLPAQNNTHKKPLEEITAPNRQHFSNLTSTTEAVYAPLDTEDTTEYAIQSYQNTQEPSSFGYHQGIEFSIGDAMQAAHGLDHLMMPGPLVGESTNAEQEGDIVNSAQVYSRPDMGTRFCSETQDDEERTVQSISTSMPAVAQQNQAAATIVPESIEDLSSAKLLFLLRGLPGSGKTTKAMHLTNNAEMGVILAADDYFTNEQGVYTFDKSKIKHAHESCKQRAKSNMEKGVTPICIDNTNTQKYEMKPYVLMAERHGYKVNLVEPTTEWRFDAEICHQKSSKNHSLRVEDVKKMKKRYQRNIKIEDIKNCENPLNRR